MTTEKDGIEQENEMVDKDKTGRIEAKSTEAEADLGPSIAVPSSVTEAEVEEPDEDGRQPDVHPDGSPVDRGQERPTVSIGENEIPEADAKNQPGRPRDAGGHTQEGGRPRQGNRHRPEGGLPQEDPFWTFGTPPDTWGSSRKGGRGGHGGDPSGLAPDDPYWTFGSPPDTWGSSRRKEGGKQASNTQRTRPRAYLTCLRCGVKIERKAAHRDGRVACPFCNKWMKLVE